VLEDLERPQVRPKQNQPLSANKYKLSLCQQRGPVHSVAIHPSGKLALSVGKDKTLRLWNLLKGRIGFTSNTQKPGDIVRWNSAGTKYGYLADTIVKIFDSAVSFPTLLNL